MGFCCRRQLLAITSTFKLLTVKQLCSGLRFRGRQRLAVKALVLVRFPH